MRYSTVLEAFRPCLPAVLALLGFSCIINLLMLTGPLYMLQIYDRVYRAAAFKRWSRSPFWFSSSTDSTACWKSFAPE